MRQMIVFAILQLSFPTCWVFCPSYKEHALLTGLSQKCCHLVHIWSFFSLTERFGLNKGHVMQQQQRDCLTEHSTASTALIPCWLEGYRTSRDNEEAAVEYHLTGSQSLLFA